MGIRSLSRVSPSIAFALEAESHASAEFVFQQGIESLAATCKRLHHLKHRTTRLLAFSDVASSLAVITCKLNHAVHVNITWPEGSCVRFLYEGPHVYHDHPINTTTKTNHIGTIQTWCNSRKAPSTSCGHLDPRTMSIGSWTP